MLRNLCVRNLQKVRCWLSEVDPGRIECDQLPETQVASIGAGFVGDTLLCILRRRAQGLRVKVQSCKPRALVGIPTFNFMNFGALARLEMLESSYANRKGAGSSASQQAVRKTER